MYDNGNSSTAARKFIPSRVCYTEAESTTTLSFIRNAFVVLVADKMSSYVPVEGNTKLVSS